VHRCAQPGDNVVEHNPCAVGSVPNLWDAVWVAAATISPIPRRSTDQARSSTISNRHDTPSDLGGCWMSTASTAPMTTFLR
jgi:hypothetical protein